MHQFIWLIPILPLVGFILIGILNKRLPIQWSGGIASVAVFLSFLISLGVFKEVQMDNFVPERIVYFNWIAAGNLTIDFAFFTLMIINQCFKIYNVTIFQLYKFT